MRAHHCTDLVLYLTRGCAALILQEESADLYTILSKLLWDTTQYANVANLCVQFQRTAENARHYNALANKTGWSEAAVQLKVRHFSGCVCTVGC